MSDVFNKLLSSSTTPPHLLLIVPDKAAAKVLRESLLATLKGLRDTWNDYLGMPELRAKVDEEMKVVDLFLRQLGYTEAGPRKEEEEEKQE